MAVSYYIEVLDNLGLVDIYVKLDQHVHQSDVLLVDDSTLRLNIATTLVLPASVNTARATTSTLPAKNGSSWLRMRAPISRSTNHLQHLKSTVPLSQIDGPISADSVRGFTAICCRSCHSQLTHSARDVVVRDLPSTYWSELVECWVCHPEEDKLRINPDLLHLFEPDTGKVACQEAEGKGADVWVGNTHLLAPGSLFRGLPTRNVELDKKTRFHNSYMELRCDSCSYVIGEVGYMGPKRLLKLLVHRIDICFDETPSLGVSLSQTVSKELVDHAAAHALYHFVIEERKSCEPVALVSMTAWNTDIVAKNGNSSASGRCIKVAFMDSKADGFTKKVKDIEANGSAEHIALLKDDCDELLGILKDNSLLFPLPFRMMPNGTSSFLHM